MSSFSIVDDNNNLKYKFRFIPIFSILASSWNNSLKTKAFNIVYQNQSVLFTGCLSGFPSALSYTHEIKIRFNLTGSTNYTYEILRFPVDDGGLHSFFPINFVKIFTTPGLYDVYIESPTFSSGANSFDSGIPKDFLNLNVNLYDLIVEEDNFEL
jgi:hypothetical protein